MLSAWPLQDAKSESLEVGGSVRLAYQQQLTGKARVVSVLAAGSWWWWCAPGSSPADAVTQAAAALVVAAYGRDVPHQAPFPPLSSIGRLRKTHPLTPSYSIIRLLWRQLG